MTLYDAVRKNEMAWSEQPDIGINVTFIINVMSRNRSF